MNPDHQREEIIKNALFILIIITLSTMLIFGADYHFNLDQLEFEMSRPGAISAPDRYISPSPSMNGMGEIGVCLPDGDPVTGYFNPANGLRSYNGVSVAYSNMETNWLQNLASDIKLKHSYLGLNLIPAKYPFQLVLSRQITILDLGEGSQMSSKGYSIATRYFGKL